VNDAPHDHTRPDRATQQTVLDIARAILVRNPPAAHRAISDAACPSCVAIAATQLGFTLAVVFTGGTFVSEPLRARLLAAINAAQAELDAFPN
jgi:hypothetical protein